MNPPKITPELAIGLAAIFIIPAVLYLSSDNKNMVKYIGNKVMFTLLIVGIICLCGAYTEHQKVVKKQTDDLKSELLQEIKARDQIIYDKLYIVGEEVKGINKDLLATSVEKMNVKIALEEESGSDSE